MTRNATMTRLAVASLLKEFHGDGICISRKVLFWKEVPVAFVSKHVLLVSVKSDKYCLGEMSLKLLF